MSQLALSLLGTPEIRYQEQVLKFRTRKACALLIYLVLEGGMHSREKLMALLWPDLDEQQGRTILRRTLALLRDALGEATAMPHETHLAVERNALGVRPTSTMMSDVALLNAAFARVRSHLALDRVRGEERHQLEIQVREALHQVRGAFLEDFLLPDAPTFDTWMSTQREALRYRVSVLFDSLSALQMEGGELFNAHATASRWVAFDPGDEAATRRLMQVSFMVGKRDEALRVYKTARAWLSRELGVEPTPETMALAERLRREQPLRLSRPLQPSSQFSVASVHLDGLLVGRNREYASLVEHYHRVTRQETHLVLLEGEAGSGKTRLVTDFLAWAAMQGADVLHGRAFANGRSFPYQLVVDTLRRRVEQENAPDDLLNDIWLSELSRILPELRDRYPDLPVPLVDEPTGQTRLFEAVARLGKAWALRRPLVVFVDDLQWSDSASRNVLFYALHRWRESQLPVLLIASVCTEELLAQPDLQAWLFNLKQEGPALALTLEALRYEDLVQWVQYLDERSLQQGSGKMAGKEMNRATADGTSFVQWLFNKTRGQPLYVEEVFRTLLERQMLRALRRPDGTWAIDTSVTDAEIAQWHDILPSRIHDTIRMRLTHVSSVARLVLNAVSVFCRDFTFEQLCQVTELLENDALQALDELLCHHLLIEQVNGAVTYSFSHDILREVVYGEISESRRRIFYRRVLQRLQADFAPEALIAHYERYAELPASVAVEAQEHVTKRYRH
jgi:DNA-binding SARP family transcriptional activator